MFGVLNLGLRGNAMYFIFIAGDEDMFLVNSAGSRVIPEHLADGSKASSLALRLMKPLKTLVHEQTTAM